MARAGTILAVLGVAVATAGLLLPAGLGGPDPVGGVLAGAAPGVLPGDGGAHVAKAWLWVTTLAAGEAPTWSNAWYAGFPLHRYYGPGFPALVAALAPTLRVGEVDPAEVTRATAAVAWVGGVAGAWAAGRLARPGIARVVAVGVAGVVPLGLAAITQAGLVPLALVHPLAALAVGGVVHGGRRGTAAAALGAAAVTIVHVQYGLLLALALPLVAATRPELVPGGAPVRRPLRDGLVGAGLFAGMVAWLVVPGALLRDAAVLGADPWTEPWWDPEAGPANWVALVRWARDGDGWIVHYAGLSTLALAARGARDRALRPHAALVLLALVAAAAQPRLLHLALPSLAALAGEGVARLGKRADPLRGSAGPAQILAVLALALDLGSTVAPVRWRPLPDLPLAGRTVVLADGRATFWRGLDALDPGATAALGGLPQAATPALASLAGAVAAAKREAEPSPATLAALRAAGVDAVVDARDGVVVPVPGAARAYFATVALPADPLPLPDWRTLRDGVADGTAPLLPLDLVDLAPDAPVARAVLIPGAAPPEGPAPLADFALLAATETPSTATLRYRSDRAGWLRLATAAFPGHVVTVDGGRVPWEATDAGFVAVAVPAGEHAVHLHNELLPGERALLGVGALTLVVAVAAALFPERRKSESPR